MLVTLDAEGLALLKRCKAFVKKEQKSKKGILFVELSKQDFLKEKPFKRYAGRLKEFLKMDPAQEFDFPGQHHVAVIENPALNLYADLKVEEEKRPKKKSEREKQIEKARGFGWLCLVSPLQFAGAAFEFGDVVTDFVFWFNIPTSEDLAAARICVLVFAFIGLLLQVPKWVNIRACLQAGINKWRFLEREVVMGLLISLFEDCPQITLVFIVTANAGFDDLAQLSIGFSILSVILKCSVPVFLHYGYIMEKPAHLASESWGEFISRICASCFCDLHVAKDSKDVVCVRWKNGHCRLGDKCRFAHPELKSRSKSPPQKRPPKVKKPVPKVKKPTPTISNPNPTTKKQIGLVPVSLKDPSSDEDYVVENNKRVCRHWKRGFCKLGDSCGFAHPDGGANRKSPEGSVTPPFMSPPLESGQAIKPLSAEKYEELSKKRRALCQFYQEGTCTWAQFCAFQHPDAASHKAPTAPLCGFFFRKVGCRNGEACRGRHYLLPEESSQCININSGDAGSGSAAQSI